MRIFLLFFCLLIVWNTQAQKFGYVDMTYILNQMEEYKTAKKDIETLAENWEKEIQEMYIKVEAMQSALQAEEVLLTKEMYEERQVAIDKKWKEIKDYQNSIFGFDGIYFLKKKELIKPIQDRIFSVVEKVAKKNRLQIVFDKSSQLVMIYTNPVHDYTDFVIEELTKQSSKPITKQ